ncbi:16S rRNA (uracil(1498)-N(3))-methyltransferase [bacterium]|nr:16S rRNA (uracil(1498)-N(3))-methyltransferase [bacterium]
MAHNFLFFSDKIDSKNQTLELDFEEFKHVFKVLKKSHNEPFFVTDGKGRTYLSRLENASKNSCKAKILQLHKETKQENSLTLAVGLLHSNRFEILVEKCAEIGVKKIIPVKFENIKERVKIERWEKIAVSALKQSSGDWLTEIAEPITFDEVLKLNFSQKFIAHEGFGLQSLRKDFDTKKETIVLIGSEKGFTENELQKAAENDFLALSLGKKRLRTETASIVVASFFIEKA